MNRTGGQQGLAVINARDPFDWVARFQPSKLQTPGPQSRSPVPDGDHNPVVVQWPQRCLEDARQPKVGHLDHPCLPSWLPGSSVSHDQNVGRLRTGGCDTLSVSTDCGDAWLVGLEVSSEKGWVQRRVCWEGLAGGVYARVHETIVSCSKQQWFLCWATLTLALCDMQCGRTCLLACCCVAAYLD